MAPISKTVAVSGSSSKPGPSSLVRAYLVAYNVACIFGWGYMDYLIASHFWGGGSKDGLWSRVSLPLKILQTAAAVEVLHAAFGWVRSGVFTAFLQGSWWPCGPRRRTSWC